MSEYLTASYSISIHVEEYIASSWEIDSFKHTHKHTLTHVVTHTSLPNLAKLRGRRKRGKRLREKQGKKVHKRIMLIIPIFQ